MIEENHVERACDKMTEVGGRKRRHLDDEMMGCGVRGVGVIIDTHTESPLLPLESHYLLNY